MHVQGRGIYHLSDKMYIAFRLVICVDTFISVLNIE